MLLCKNTRTKSDKKYACLNKYSISIGDYQQYNTLVAVAKWQIYACSYVCKFQVRKTVSLNNYNNYSICAVYVYDTSNIVGNHKIYFNV